MFVCVMHLACMRPCAKQSFVRFCSDFHADSIGTLPGVVRDGGNCIHDAESNRVVIAPHQVTFPFDTLYRKPIHAGHWSKILKQCASKTTSVPSMRYTMQLWIKYTPSLEDLSRDLLKVRGG